MAPSNPIMMETDMMYLCCESYHLLAVSDDRMFIFIVLIFPIHRQIFFWNYCQLFISFIVYNSPDDS